MGGGKWYGVPNYGEYVMVYYNKDLFAKHNVAVPTTFAQFKAAMDTFVKAGDAAVGRRRGVPGAADLLPARALQGAPDLRGQLPALRSKVDFKGPS